jgi:hypothetical protein
MFRITQAQLETFDRIARADFYRHLATYLREVMPEETAAYGDDALLGYITASAHRASTYRIETESGIAQWTCLSLVFGLGFEDVPAMREYFKVTGMDPEEKLEVLVDGLNEALLDPLKMQD